MPWVDNDTFETETWRYVEARNKGVRRTAKVRGKVVHAPVTGEGQDTAISVARYFRDSSRAGSTHTVTDGGTDGDNIIQCVKDSIVAYGAAGGNHDFMHGEIAGMPDQSREEWLDDYSKRAMEFDASVTAQYALKYGFPIRRIGVDQVRRGEKGITGHKQISDAYRLSNHWDPGPHFPWDWYIDACHRWHHYWLQTHPGFNPEPEEPDFKVVVIASSDENGDVEEGMARVYAKHNELKFMEWPFRSVSFGAAVVIGSHAAQDADQIQSDSWENKVQVISGRNVDVIAERVAYEISKGKRTIKDFPY